MSMFDKSAKRFFVTIGVLLVMLISLLFSISFTAKSEGEPASTAQAGINCQYPDRPLVDGHCNNTDPACPETVKFDGGDCSSMTAEQVKAIYQPAVDPTPPSIPTASSSCR